MKYLLDTCLISELVKKAPNPAVVSWLDEQDEQSLFLSILTVGELQKGISKLPDGARKDDLQAWIEHDLALRFSGRIIDVDLETMLAWGRLQGESEQKGESLPVMDSLIASAAKAYGLVVVTRNVKDMERCHVRVRNPWGSEVVSHTNANELSLQRRKSITSRLVELSAQLPKVSAEKLQADLAEDRRRE